ncbi:hypothetical protein [Streptomyces sp. SS]|nr:hypothetical protein [Streptomyces sp. SS]
MPECLDRVRTGFEPDSTWAAGAGRLRESAAWDGAMGDRATVAKDSTG